MASSRLQLSLLVLATVLATTSSQTCDQATVKWTDAVPATQWAGVYFSIQPLLTEQCNSEVLSLGACSEDLANQKGCCSAGCSAAIKAASPACLQDYTCHVATSDKFSTLLKFQQALNERCLGATLPTETCKKTAGSNVTAPAAPPAAPVCNDTNKYPLVAKNTSGTCATTKFADVVAETRLALTDAAYNIPASCWDNIANLTATCSADLLVRSGCCSAACAQAMSLVPEECMPVSYREVCNLGPSKPHVKAFLNTVKRCEVGVVAPCNITNTTYPLKIWDTCDCPIKESDWKDFSVRNISEIVPVLKAGVTDACFNRAVGVLPICADELQKEDGCCSTACWDVLNDPSTKGCYDSYLASICKMKGGEKYARTFMKTARRCIDDTTFNPVCPNATAGTPPGTSNAAAGNTTNTAKKSSARGLLPGALAVLAALVAAALLL